MQDGMKVFLYIYSSLISLSDNMFLSLQAFRVFQVKIISGMSVKSFLLWIK